jgi:SAM-dependent methyltransferase
VVPHGGGVPPWFGTVRKRHEGVPRRTGSARIRITHLLYMQGKSHTMSFLSWLINQSGKPSGWLGRINLWRMGRRHSGLTEWGLAHVSVASRDTVLDVGCGGGKTVARLAAMATDGKTYGIDYSVTSVAASRRANRKAIASGRAAILLGSVSCLPFPTEMFDLVTAVETHYYWADLNGDAQEILRVLKHGGAFILIAEAYKSVKCEEMVEKFEKLQGITEYSLLSAGEHREMFTKAGYCDVRVFEEHDKGWICVAGNKS